tara:strand:- start:236 stop:481 length:246 start_codon:yes stop_codon:yes gene_type:complete
MNKNMLANFKNALDHLLIINLFIILSGAIIFLLSAFFSANGNDSLYNLLQRLWFPLYIPSLSLFFTAVLVVATQNLSFKDN